MLPRALMPPPPPTRPPPSRRHLSSSSGESVNSSAPHRERQAWNDRFGQGMVGCAPPKKPLPVRPTYESTHGGSVKSRIDTGNRSRPGSSSSTGSRPGSKGSRQRQLEQEPPYMPWLTKEPKSMIDNKAPFSHRNSSSFSGRAGSFRREPASSARSDNAR